jgi:superfamily I DNA/RNA helicase
VDKKMKEIHIECAGAGKTYGIAQKIMNILDDCPDEKKIYVITYTHYAVKQIRDELIRTIRDIPEKVIIVTAHSFFLNNIVYPYSHFIKGEIINSCSIERLIGKVEWQAKRKRILKDMGLIHADEVYQYAKSLLVATKSDTVAVKKRKEIAVSYFISDIYCLFVDEAQDMEDSFFELMLKLICKLKNFYFVGDPFQALWGQDKYKEFAEKAGEQEGIVPVINLVSRRIPTCIVPLCNIILPDSSKLSSCSNESGVVAYVMLSELNATIQKQLASSNVFSYIKIRTNVFSTANDQAGLTHEFVQILTEKYQLYDADALRRAVIRRILEIGLDNYLSERKIELSRREYAELASQFGREKGSGIFVESIQKIKGLENDTAYFIICNSLLELLLRVKNDFNKETNLLYVALTRTKRRLLLVIDDDEGLRKNFHKRKIDINIAMSEIGIQKAVIKEWIS